MTTPRHELPPRLIVNEDGEHFAVCPACGENTPVPVTHEEDRSVERPFVVARDADGKATETVWPERAIYDWSGHETHVRRVHENRA
jgi:hypothetical protein